MANAALTPDQEAVAHKIDSAGLALIGAGVLGEVMHRHGAAGGMMQRVGHQLHEAGPYMDLAGLAMIAPPVMHPLARKLSPESVEEPVAPGAPGSDDALEQAKVASYAYGAYEAQRRFLGRP